MILKTAQDLGLSVSEARTVRAETGNFHNLRSRVERLGLSNAVSLVNAAAVEAPGQVRLALNPDNPADHRVASAGVLVNGVSVDALVEERGWPLISFIKIDVQGGELPVIRGASQTLRRFRPVHFVEFDELCLAQAGTSATELLRELLARGYKPHAMSSPARGCGSRIESFAREHRHGATSISCCCKKPAVLMRRLGAIGRLRRKWLRNPTGPGR